MVQPQEEYIAWTEDALAELIAMTTSPQELTTIWSLVWPFMQKRIQSYEQESEAVEPVYTAPMNPASNAGTSAKVPDSPISYIQQALDTLSSILERKNFDYKISSEFSNFEHAAKTAGVTVEQVILTQIGIKLGRLEGLPKSPFNESRQDTLQDLAGYATILYAYNLYRTEENDELW